VRPGGSGARFAAVLVVLALAVNLATLFLVRGHATVERLDADEREYWSLASNLLQGSLRDHPARRTIGFPATVAAARWLVGDEYLRVQLALMVLVGLSPLLVHRLVRRELGSERAARLAGMAALFWPTFVRFGTTLYSDSIALMVFLVHLNVTPPRAWSRDAPGFPWARWGLSGLLLGLSMHIRPMYLLYSPIAALLALWSPIGLRRRLLSCALLAAGCLFIVAPWSAYLSLREGRPILLSANAGETMAGGLNPGLVEMGRNSVLVTPENRATWVGPGKWLPPEQTGLLSPEEQNLPYTEASKLLAERATRWVRSHPREVLYLTGRKLLYMWGLYPPWNGLTQSLLGNFPLLALVAAAFVALARFRRHLPELAVFWTLPLFSSMVACVSWGSWRFRMPGDVGLIALTAGLVAGTEVRRFLVAGSGASLPPGHLGCSPTDS
jgi:4-amino-4-deoxy-L-arabinose transferase-like glycosyltransferase